MKPAQSSDPVNTHSLRLLASCAGSSIRCFGLRGDTATAVRPCGASGSGLTKPTEVYHGDAGWSSPVARQAHNLKVTGSNPVPATNKIIPHHPKPSTLRHSPGGLADTYLQITEHSQGRAAVEARRRSPKQEAMGVPSRQQATARRNRYRFRRVAWPCVASIAAV